MAMFARLSKSFRRASVDGRETREGRKDAGLPSENNEGLRRWSWRMWGDSAESSRPYHRQNPLYEEWKSKEKEIMTFLHNLEMDNIAFQENNQELKKEINFYCNLHSRILMEMNLIKKKLVILQQESKEVQADWPTSHQYLVDLNLSGKDEQENTSNLETQESQKTARELGLATAQEESILQKELPPQKPPAEHHPQHSQSSFDESSSIEFISLG
ncbi:disks large homolog 5-like [Mus pahari]|uniref:disks large homolog 5-like n=1 Tax=Mus pahari TaxID=10093 RepID=UPI000A306835|nr:disks large homolog 5-like [Mus pahari]